MSWARGRSCSGCSPVSASSSPTSSAWRPSARSASIRSSRQARRELLQPGDLGLREGLVAEVGEGRAAPERQRFAQGGRCCARVSATMSRRASSKSCSKRSRSHSSGATRAGTRPAGSAGGHRRRAPCAAATPTSATRSRRPHCRPRAPHQPLRRHGLVRVHEQIGKSARWRGPPSSTARSPSTPRAAPEHGTPWLPPGRRTPATPVPFVAAWVRMKRPGLIQIAQEPLQASRQLWKAPGRQAALYRSDPTTKPFGADPVDIRKDRFYVRHNKEEPMRVVLLTGCSSGIGLHAALAFARQGDRVYATMRTRVGVAAMTEGRGCRRARA